MWEIHTFGNGDVIASVLMGIRLLMMTGPYIGLLLFAALLLTAMAIGNFAVDRRKYLPLFFGIIVIYFIGTQIPVDVLVVDEVNSDVADQVVAAIPLAVALPAYVSGYAGWRFTQLVETAFAVPADYSTGQSTLNKPLFDLQKILGAEIRDGDLESRLESYLSSCVFKEMDLDPPLVGSPSIGVLWTSGDLLSAISTVSLAYEVGPTSIPCATYYTGELLPRFLLGTPGYDKTRRYLQADLQVVPLSLLDDEGIANRLLGTLLPAGQTGIQLIHNAMIIKSWRQARTHESGDYKDVTRAVADLQRTLTINLKEQSFSTSRLVQKMVPMLRTMIEGIVYLSVPIVLVLAMSPAMGAVLGLYIKMFLWLQTWGPLYAVLNLVFYQEARARLASITAAGGFGSVNLSSYDSYLELVSMMNSVAGDYIWMVPAVGWALVWGGSSIGSALSGAGRSAQSTSSQIAGEFASGRGQTMLEGQGVVWEPKTRLASGEMTNGTIGLSSGSQQVMMPTPGSTGVSMVNQAGVISHFGGDGSRVEVASNGNRSISDVHGTRQYSQRNGSMVLESGAFRENNVLDTVSGQTVEAQVQGLGGGQKQMDFQINTPLGPASVRSLINSEGKETDRRVEGVRGSVKWVANSSDQSESASVVASGSTSLFAVFGKGEQQRIVPITGSFEGTGVGNKSQDPSLATLSAARITSNVDKTKSMTGSVTSDGKNMFMQVTGGAENEQYMSQGFIQIGHSQIPISEISSPTNPSQRATFGGKAEVRSEPIYSSDGVYAGNYTGELAVGGQSITQDSEGRLLDHPISDAQVFSLNGGRFEGSSDRVMATGRVGLDGKPRFDRLDKMNGEVTQSSGSLHLGKGPLAPEFKGISSTAKVNGHDVTTLKEGTVTFANGRIAAVQSGTVEDGHPIRLQTSNGPIDVEMSEDGKTQTVREGTSKETMTTTGMPVQLPQHLVGPVESGEDGGKLVPIANAVFSVTTTTDPESGAVTSSLATLSGVGPTGKGFEVSGTAAKLPSLTGGTLGSSLSTAGAHESESGRPVQVHAGSERNWAFYPSRGSSGYSISDGVVTLGKDLKPTFTQSQVSPMTGDAAFTDSKSGGVALNGFTRHGSGSLSIGEQNIAGETTSFYANDRGKPGALLSETFKQGKNSAGILVENVGGKLIPTEFTQKSISGSNASITNRNQIGTNALAMEVPLTGGEKAFALVNQSVVFDAKKQQETAGDVGQVLAQHAVRDASSQITAFTMMPDGSKQFGHLVSHADPDHPEQQQFKFTATNESETATAEGRVANKTYSDAGRLLLENYAKGDSTVDSHSYMKNDSIEGRATVLGMAFYQMGIDPKNPGWLGESLVRSVANFEAIEGVAWDAAKWVRTLGGSGRSGGSSLPGSTSPGGGGGIHRGGGGPSSGAPFRGSQGSGGNSGGTSGTVYPPTRGTVNSGPFTPEELSQLQSVGQAGKALEKSGQLKGLSERQKTALFHDLVDGSGD